MLNFEKLLEKIQKNDFIDSFLDLSGQALKDEEIIKLAEALKNNHHVKKVDLSYNDIGDNGIKAICAIDTINELDLHNGLDGYDEYYNHITSSGAEAIARSNLKKLNISGNLIGDDGVKFLSSNKTIVDLNIEDCGISAEGTKVLFKTNNTLVKLSLRANGIGDDGLSTIASNHTLKELDLSNCKITHIGAKFIGDNNCLSRLQLSGNKISEGTCFLARHPNLEFLGLNQCEITDDDLFEFSINSVLKELLLQYNKITSKGIEILSKNSTLTSLHLGSNDIYFDETTLKFLLSMKSLTVFTGQDNRVAENIKEIVEEIFSKSFIKQLDLTVHNSLHNTICIQYNSKKTQDRQTKRKAEELILSPSIKIFISQADQWQVEEFIQDVTSLIKEEWEREHKKQAFTVDLQVLKKH